MNVDFPAPFFTHKSMYFTLFLTESEHYQEPLLRGIFFVIPFSSRMYSDISLIPFFVLFVDFILTKIINIFNGKKSKRRCKNFKKCIILNFSIVLVVQISAQTAWGYLKYLGLFKMLYLAMMEVTKKTDRSPL